MISEVIGNNVIFGDRDRDRDEDEDEVSDTDHLGAKGALNDQSGSDPERSEGTEKEKEKEKEKENGKEKNSPPLKGDRGMSGRGRGRENRLS